MVKKGVTTYFLAQKSGLFRLGAATILANSPLKTVSKPKFGLRKEGQKKLGRGGGQSSGGLPVSDTPIVPYVAKAIQTVNGGVHSTMLSSVPIDIPTPIKYTISGWVRLSLGGDINFNLCQLVGSNSFLASSFWNVAGDVYSDNYATDPTQFITASPDALLIREQWFWMGVNVDATGAVGDRTGNIYIGDVNTNVSPDNGGQDTGNDPMVFSTTPDVIRIRALQDLEIGLSDIWIGLNQYLDFSVEANRQKFISASGKPVYLGADGSIPTGVAPIAFLSGDADTFLNNAAGTGTFSVTTGDPIINASTSPSD